MTYSNTFEKPGRKFDFLVLFDIGIGQINVFFHFSLNTQVPKEKLNMKRILEKCLKIL